MKYIKQFEKFSIKEIGDWIKTKSVNDKILNDLLIDIDESKIMVKTDTVDPLNRDYSYVEYEKNNVEYTIKVVEEHSKEVGPSTHYYFYINNKYCGRYSKKKLRKLYNTLIKIYNEFTQDINKYNL